MTVRLLIEVKGGPGSGNWGHAGRPGLVGGSGGGAGGAGGAWGMVARDHTGNTGRREQVLYDIIYGDQYKGIMEGEGVGEGVDVLTTDYPRDANSMIITAWNNGLIPNVAKDIADATGMDEDFIGTTLADWGSSGNNPDSLKIQIAVSEEWSGSKLSSWQEGEIAKGNVATTPEHRRLVRTMYDDTQKMFRDHGYKPDDEILLYRGIGGGKALPPAGTVISHESNAAASWTLNSQTATGFGSAIAAKIPVRDILSTGATGFGTMSEAEMAVLGRGVQDVLLIHNMWGD